MAKKYTVTITNEVFYDIEVEGEDKTSIIDKAWQTLMDSDDPSEFISGEAWSEDTHIEEVD